MNVNNTEMMMKTFVEITNWIRKHSYWEQYAFAKILNGEAFSEDDYNFLLGVILEDGEVYAKTRPRPPLAFAEPTPEAVEASRRDPQSGPNKIVEISNVKNVNALAPKHRMEFSCDSNTLTVIYGGNGSGKSGYARILGSAGFCRGDQQVLPNQTSKSATSENPSATITVLNGNDTKTFEYICGQSCPELSSFYVFDSLSITSHLAKKNSFGFSPGGLSSLTALAEVVDELSKRLKDKIQRANTENIYQQLFDGESAVATAVSQISATTDMEALKKLGTLSEQDEADHEKVKEQIAILRALDVPTKIKQNSTLITQIDQLASRIEALANKLSQVEYNSISKLLDDYQKWEKAATASGAKQFESLGIKGIGENIWQTFLKAARDLAETQHPGEQIYPQEGDRCLLCNQKLTPDASDLIHRFWVHLKADAQTQLNAIQASLGQKKSGIGQIVYGLLHEDSALHAFLKTQEPELITKITAFANEREQIGKSIHASIETKTTLPDKKIDKQDWPFERIKADLNKNIEGLRQRDPTQELFEYEKKNREYEHRVLLGKHLTEIEKLVKRLSALGKASLIKLSTAKISSEQNRLFGKLVTEKYKSVFEHKLAALGRPLKVEVSIGSQKGGSVKQIVLSGTHGKATPDKVLSEGERKVVALADFFTEVELDQDNGGILLDDPVNSLDFAWKGSIAEEIVHQATLRQVIVMTHDLHFLYLLTDKASDGNVEMLCHWVKRGDADDIPGYVFLNNSPSMEQSYKNSSIARSYYERAIKAEPQQQEFLLKQGFGALRTSYEAMIIYDLFNDAVHRFAEEISFPKLKQVVLDRQIYEEVINKCELLSRFFEGHTHSDNYAAEKPVPKMLLAEIENFIALKKRIRRMKEVKYGSEVGSASIIPIKTDVSLEPTDDVHSPLLDRVATMRETTPESNSDTSSSPDIPHNPN